MKVTFNSNLHLQILIKKEGIQYIMLSKTTQATQFF
jgi:hypothetical protein